MAVAANMKFPYCSLTHTAMAKFYGAADEELAEVG
jgi:alkylhydroperoxidase/carboxymuconolactone decarboxylase family protein YurZ